MEIVKIINVKPIHDFVDAIEFSDGVKKDIDLSPYLHGEVFEPIRNDSEVFRSVRVLEGERTISWPNGADIDPYTLYFGLSPEWSEEDEALAAALEQRRKGIPFIPTEMTKPKLGIR